MFICETLHIPSGCIHICSGGHYTHLPPVAMCMDYDLQLRGCPAPSKLLSLHMSKTVCLLSTAHLECDISAVVYFHSSSSKASGLLPADTCLTHCCSRYHQAEMSNAQPFFSSSTHSIEGIGYRRPGGWLLDLSGEVELVWEKLKCVLCTVLLIM